MLQWIKPYSQYNDYSITWTVSFENSCLSVLGTKCHTDSQNIALENFSKTGVTIHTALSGTSFIWAIGY